MDRIFVYPGAIPLDVDELNTNRNAMIAVGYALQAAFGVGSGTMFVDGLACTPTGTGSLQANIAPGSIMALTEIDPNAYGSLSADTNPLVKMGIMQAAVNTGSSGLTTITAPGTVGQAQNYLIEATFEEADVNPVVLPYYNASNPSVPYSGPGNTGTPQNTLRQEVVELKCVAGTPAASGSQTTPAVDSGYVGLYVITVSYGQTQLSSGNIVVYAGAPFISQKLGQNIGFRNTQILSGSGTFVVPNGVSLLKVTVVGGGGGGGGTTTTSSAQTSCAPGGNSGASAVYKLVVTPGQSISYSVGAGGTAGATAGGTGGTGGNTTFGAVTAGGGAGGPGQSAQTPPYVQCSAANTATVTGIPTYNSSLSGVAGVAVQGGPSMSGTSLNGISGKGGDGPFGGGGASLSSVAGTAGSAPGAGGAGGAIDQNTSAVTGGAGAAGTIIVEY